MKFFNTLLTRTNKPLRERLSAATEVSMDADVKKKTRAMLAEYASMKPVRPAGAGTQKAAPASVLSYFQQHTHLTPMPVFVAALIFMFTGGTAYAAQGALPGDPLYPIKVGVTEPLQGALATTPQAKAEWSVELAQRRLQEASTLASQGRLNNNTSNEIQTNLDAQVQVAATQTKELQKSDAPGAIETSAHLAAVLNSHSDVLNAISDATTSNDTRAQVRALVANVAKQVHAAEFADAGEHAREASDARSAAPVTMMATMARPVSAASSTPEPRTLAATTALQQIAQQRIQTASKMLTQAGASTASTSPYATAAAKLADAQKAYAAAAQC